MSKKRIYSIKSAEALDKIQRLLVSYAPSDATCGEKYYRCCESDSQEFHFCCAAHKICTPNQKASLKFEDFIKTLKHYRIKPRNKTCRTAYDAYLVDVSIAENEESLNHHEDIISSLEEKLQNMDGTDSEEKTYLIEQLNKACISANQITYNIASNVSFQNHNKTDIH